ncbi:MAG TPA: hypothetical protein VNA16_09875 [Abditibacteriaceae bacterium]|nr:hypothetical protein [Abditibacteriaceae bacterium]
MNFHLRKNQDAGRERGAIDLPAHCEAGGGALIYGGVALGVLAGAALSTYLWRQRMRALNLLHTSPLERAEQLITSCESKLEAIERSVQDLKTARS